jgi:hypothetical protein
MGGHLDTPLTRQPRSSRFLCRPQATCSRVLQSPLEGRCSRRTALEGQRGLRAWETLYKWLLYTPSSGQPGLF